MAFATVVVILLSGELEIIEAVSPCIRIEGAFRTVPNAPGAVLTQHILLIILNSGLRRLDRVDPLPCFRACWCSTSG